MKPIIEDVKLSKEKLAELNKILKLKISTKSKSRMIRNYIGGTCVVCYGIPSKIVRYDVNGAQLVDRYCDSCLDKADLVKRLQNMNFAY